MEQQIQDLVESIKRDGINEAEKKSAQIIDAAQKKAEQIIAQSEKEAASIIEKAQKEVSVMESSGKEAVKQASRDVILSLKKSIYDHMDRLLTKKVKTGITDKQLVSLIVQVVKGGLEDPAQTVLEVNPDQIASLEESLRGDLEKELKAGLTIKAVPQVDVGFRLTDKSGSSYYDFSDEEISSLLKPFLNTAISQILSEE
ncbi:MAG: V-type ATP synthase subunit E [Sphaerochaetaceae bacterium]|nr:V-type ATP synthase subunit E [Sphaerochaetaceae bacterium]MDC7246733.1 V-type ATP synthase subunit E [Sphaerochaetaceae bacterium]